MGLQRVRHDRAPSLSFEKEMATHSSTLAWKISWMEKPAGYSPWGNKESGEKKKGKKTQTHEY